MAHDISAPGELYWRPGPQRRAHAAKDRRSMSEESSKPGGAPPFSAQDAMAFMQRMWNPFAMPMPGSTTGAVAPSAPSASPASPEQPESAAAEPASASAFQSLMGGMLPGML